MIQIEAEPVLPASARLENQRSCGIMPSVSFSRPTISSRSDSAE